MPVNILELIANCKNGDRASQIQLYDTYAAAMYKVALRYVKNEEDAKDVMQEGFIKLFTHLDSYNPNYTLGAWLKRIVINCCIDFLKQKRLVFDALPEQDLAVPLPEIQLGDLLTKKQLLEAMMLLPEPHKLVVKLYLIEGYNHEEIGQILNIPQASSRTYLRRGRLRLQEILKHKKVNYG